MTIDVVEADDLFTSRGPYKHWRLMWGCMWFWIAYHHKRRSRLS